MEHIIIEFLILKEILTDLPKEQNYTKKCFKNKEIIFLKTTISFSRDKEEYKMNRHRHFFHKDIIKSTARTQDPKIEKGERK